MMPITLSQPLKGALAYALSTLLATVACGNTEGAFNVEAPARGPSQLLPDDGPVSDGNFRGGDDAIPTLNGDASPDQIVASCDSECRAFCNNAGLDNPVNQGLCPSLWGLGRASNEVDTYEACRRLFMDTTGRFPTYWEVKNECSGRPWGEVVMARLDSPEFVRLNRRRWADIMGYDSTSVSIERIYDMDAVVSALYRGELSYDHFAAIASAHPVLTRRFATEGDRAEALFWLFWGRPPSGAERSDIARLYHLWTNHYYDHPELGMRLPDAFIRYRCLDELGAVNEGTAGSCTSTAFGFEQLILKPDARSIKVDDDVLMWSGHLTTNEWQKLQAPGRLLSEQWLFWEHAANAVLHQYLDYDISTLAPEIGERLVQYVLDKNGDMRALHFAVLTSSVYLQSARGNDAKPLRFTYGPLKQAEAEDWVDSLDELTGSRLRRCDLRINRPGEFLDVGSPAALALIAESDWEVNDEWSNVRTDYRDLVRTLGGCPDNSQGGRFKTISVLTTANQLNHARKVCDPSGNGSDVRADLQKLLPDGISANHAVSADSAEAIYTNQVRRFFSRNPKSSEKEQARAHGEACAREQCDAESFARNVCYALLSSAEMVFY